MRSALVVAAFAAGALAVPLMEREVVWETDVVYATQYVTVTAGDVAPAPTNAPPSYSTSSEHWGHRKKKTSSKSKSRSKAKSSSSSSKASSTAVQEAAAQETAWTSSWGYTWSESAPAETSVKEQAPAYTSTKESAPAPTSYDAPSSYSETKTSSKASSTKAASSSGAKPTGYQGMVLHHHNIHRANHSAPDLTWSDSLAATAEKIGETCVYAHSMYV
jgi:hypothetical protein